MAAMAPALTVAATQVRAKLPTVAGHLTSDSGRLDCTSPSPPDISPLTTSFADSLAGGPDSAPPAGNQSHHLLTLSKRLTGGVSTNQTFNNGLKKVTGLAKGKINILKPLPQGQTFAAVQGRATQFAKLALSVSASRSSVDSSDKQPILAHLNQRQQIQRNDSNTPSGSSQRTGDLKPFKTPNRMSQQSITLQNKTPNRTTTNKITSTEITGSGIMPHPAVAPIVQPKTTGMGYTFKTSTSNTSLPQNHPQDTLSGSGGVDSFSSSQGGGAPSPATDSENLNLPAMDEIASINMVEIQSGSNSGLADVGLLNNIDRVAETAKRQKDLERQADRLLRRIRRLQSLQTISHVQHQLSGFVDHQHKNLQTMAKAMKPQPNNSLDLKAELLQSEDVKSLSTAALVSLVRRLQTSQAMTLRQRLANSNQCGSDGTSVLRLDEDLCTEMNRVSSTLQKDLKHLESAHDSDATESSSGGESCDEDFDYDDDKAPKACLRRRAEWKWATERAAVASKWTWLQAQVSDLEYRIRQQSDIYRQIRAAKGAVVLGEAAPPEDLLPRFRAAPGTSATTPTNSGPRPGRRLSPLEEKIANLERKNEMSPCNLSTLLCNVDKQSSRLTQQLGNVLSPAESPLLAAGSQANKPPQSAPSTPPKTPKTPNGFLSSTRPGSNSDTRHNSTTPASEGPLSLSFDPPSPAVDTSCQASRCRPVRSYGKRKLLTTSGLYQLSRKAARLSTVPCQCYPPTVPCALCGGRYNNCQTVQPTVMPVGERLALLDPSYHQVLSFPQDTHLPVHFESLLRCGEWQHKPLPTKPLRPLGSTKGKQKGPVSERKYRKNASATLLSSVKIRSKYDMKQLVSERSKQNIGEPSDTCTRLGSHTPESKLKKRKTSLCSLDGSRKRRTVSVGSSGAPASSPTNASPRDTPSPLSHSCSSATLRDLKDAQQKRRRGESAFDINNIVIPYSMAASTRVEKLLYKEIITPKWREVQGDGDTEKEQSSAMTTCEEDQTPATSELCDESQRHGSALPPTPNTPNTPLLSSTEHQQAQVLTTSQTTSDSSSSSTSQTTNIQTTSIPSTNTFTTPQLPDTLLTPETPESQQNSINTEAVTESETPDKLQRTDINKSQEITGSIPCNASVKDQTYDILNCKATTMNTPEKSEKVNFKIVESPKEVGVVSPDENCLVLPRTWTPEEENEGDLSDEVIAARHMRCEIKEKKRFMSVVNKRSRGGRSDSAGDEGVLPPEMLDAPLTSAASGISAASVSSTPPGTPAMAPPPQLTALIDEELELAGERRRSGSCSSHEDLVINARRRSLSGRSRTRGMFASCSSTSLDEMQEDTCRVDPWPARTFPLSDVDYQKLFQENSVTNSSPSAEQTSPSGRPLRHAAMTTKGGYTYHTATPENSNPASPIPSSSNSSVMDDDPNDPEWTVVDGVVKPAPQQQQHPSLVLKLAKR